MTTTAPGRASRLGKTLRDGRDIELRIVPAARTTSAPSPTGWSIHWPGQAGQTFSAALYRAPEPPAPGVTHAIRVPGPAGEQLNLGLTGAEAASVKDATAAWVKARQHQRDADRAAVATAARDAVPGARTWQVPDAYGHLAAIGGTVRPSETGPPSPRSRTPALTTARTA